MKADKNSVTNLLKTARGQIDGILNMIEKDRYCIDIVNQLMAVQAVLNKANREVLLSHMQSCILHDMTDENREEKVTELIDILKKLT